MLNAYETASPNELARMLRHHESVKDSHLTARETQSARRQAALDRQRASRDKLFDLSRGELDDALDELELGQEDVDGAMQGVSQHSQTPKSSKARLKWQRRYANKLMFAETIDAASLPHDLDSEWIALAVPKGKRCLALTLGDAIRAQTLLLSRSKGRPLARRYTSLPFGTILDGVWDQERSVLFVLDALEWSGLPLDGMDTEARRFIRDAKMAELGPQPLLKGTAGDKRLLCAAVPTSDSPRAFLGEALQGALSVNISVVHVSQGTDMEEDVNTKMDTLSLPIKVDGVLLYFREAVYESGLTCLAGWLPVEGGILTNAVDDEKTMTTF